MAISKKQKIILFSIGVLEQMDMARAHALGENNQQGLIFL